MKENAKYCIYFLITILSIVGCQSGSDDDEIEYNYSITDLYNLTAESTTILVNNDNSGSIIYDERGYVICIGKNDKINFFNASDLTLLSNFSPPTGDIYPNEQSISKVITRNSRLYLSSKKSIFVFDISNIHTPIQMQELTDSDFSFNNPFEVIDNYIYIQGISGLYIYKFSGTNYSFLKKIEWPDIIDNWEIAYSEMYIADNHLFFISNFTSEYDINNYITFNIENREDPVLLTSGLINIDNAYDLRFRQNSYFLSRGSSLARKIDRMNPDGTISNIFNGPLKISLNDVVASDIFLLFERSIINISNESTITQIGYIPNIYNGYMQAGDLIFTYKELTKDVDLYHTTENQLLRFKRKI